MIDCSAVFVYKWQYPTQNSKGQKGNLLTCKQDICVVLSWGMTRFRDQSHLFWLVPWFLYAYSQQTVSTEWQRWSLPSTNFHYLYSPFPSSIYVKSVIGCLSHNPILRGDMELLTDGLNLTEWGRNQSQRELILEGLRSNRVLHTTCL